MHVLSRPFRGGALRTIVCYNYKYMDITHPGSGCFRHSTVPLGAGIIWTRMTKSSSVSNHAAAAVSSRRYIVSSPPAPSSTRRALGTARPRRSSGQRTSTGDLTAGRCALIQHTATFPSHPRDDDQKQVLRLDTPLSFTYKLSFDKNAD